MLVLAICIQLASILDSPISFGVGRQLVLSAMSAGLWLARSQMVTGTASSCFVYPGLTALLEGRLSG